MVRISGIDIPTKKCIGIALIYIFGIGYSLSKKILNEAKIDFNIKVFKLNNDQISKIRNIINKLKIENDLRREIKFNIRRLIDIKSYRGIRHKKKLPVRGQNTKNNTRTCKSLRKKKNIIINKKKNIIYKK